MWSFEFRSSGNNGVQIWTLSGRDWADWKDAWTAAGEWAYVCFENRWPVDVRLVKVDR